METTSWGIDRGAAHCGFGSEVTLRQNFQARFAVSPGRYRRRFGAGSAGAPPVPAMNPS